MRQATKISFLCILLILFSVSLFTPFHLQAQNGSPIVPTCTGSAGDGADKGCGWKDLVKEVNNFIKYLLYLSAAIATVSFSYAGFLYLTSGGKEGQVEKAKEIFLKVLIGFLVIFLAFLLVQFITKSLGLKEGYSLV